MKINSNYIRFITYKRKYSKRDVFTNKHRYLSTYLCTYVTTYISTYLLINLLTYLITNIASNLSKNTILDVTRIIPISSISIYALHLQIYSY